MIPTATNAVENICVWDGSVNTWQPPPDTLMLIQADIPAMLWEPVVVDAVVTDWILVEQIGQGDIGFTWDGVAVTTNQPKPPID